MEKDSLIKSTAKKKAAVKTASKAAKGQKVAHKKKAPAKKISAKAKSAAKKSIPRKKKPALKSLTLKQFDRWTPEKPFYVPPEDKAQQQVTAPPVVSGQSEDESRLIKGLLFKTFDLSATAEAKQPAEIEKRVEKPAFEKPKTEDREKTPVSTESKDDKKSIPFVPKPSGSYEPPEPLKSDPIDRAMKFFIGGLILLILILIGSSYTNTKNYYIKIANGDLEIWKGSFAPIGQTLLVRLVGVKPPPSIKSDYTQSEALTLAFNYYLAKSDKLIEVKGVPDFEKIRSFLSRAETYATTQKQRTITNGRLSHIDLMLLIYKADVAAAKGTMDALKKAVNYLEETSSLPLTEDQIKLVRAKKASFSKQVSDLKAKKKANAVKAKKEKQNTKAVKESKTSKEKKQGKEATP
jgi:hypothetical protein